MKYRAYCYFDIPGHERFRVTSEETHDKAEAKHRLFILEGCAFCNGEGNIEVETPNGWYDLEDYESVVILSRRQEQ
jgi:hypothetical protein